MSAAELDPALRARLAAKARILHAKSCGRDGKSGCLEGFLRHQASLGHAEVVEDFLAFLETRPDDQEAPRLRLAALAWLKEKKPEA